MDIVNRVFKVLVTDKIKDVKSSLKYKDGDERPKQQISDGFIRDLAGIVFFQIAWGVVEYFYFGSVIVSLSVLAMICAMLAISRHLTKSRFFLAKPINEVFGLILVFYYFFFQGRLLTPIVTPEILACRLLFKGVIAFLIINMVFGNYFNLPMFKGGLNHPLLLTRYDYKGEKNEKLWEEMTSQRSKQAYDSVKLILASSGADLGDWIEVKQASKLGGAGGKFKIVAARPPYDDSADLELLDQQGNIQRVTGDEFKRLNAIKIDFADYYAIDNGRGLAWDKPDTTGLDSPYHIKYDLPCGYRFHVVDGNSGKFHMETVDINGEKLYVMRNQGAFDEGQGFHMIGDLNPVNRPLDCKIDPARNQPMPRPGYDPHHVDAAHNAVTEDNLKKIGHVGQWIEMRQTSTALPGEIAGAKFEILSISPKIGGDEPVILMNQDGKRFDLTESSFVDLSSIQVGTQAFNLSPSSHDLDIRDRAGQFGLVIGKITCSQQVSLIPSTDTTGFVSIMPTTQGPFHSYFRDKRWISISIGGVTGFVESGELDFVANNRVDNMCHSSQASSALPATDQTTAAQTTTAQAKATPPADPTPAEKASAYLESIPESHFTSVYYPNDKPAVLVSSPVGGIEVIKALCSTSIAVAPGGLSMKEDRHTWFAARFNGVRGYVDANSVTRDNGGHCVN